MKLQMSLGPYIFGGPCSFGQECPCFLSVFPLCRSKSPGEGVSHKSENCPKNLQQYSFRIVLGKWPRFSVV